MPKRSLDEAYRDARKVEKLSDLADLLAGRRIAGSDFYEDALLCTDGTKVVPEYSRGNGIVGFKVLELGGRNAVQHHGLFRPPSNETVLHWFLKWAGWWYLIRGAECDYAGVELSNSSLEIREGDPATGKLWDSDPWIVQDAIGIKQVTLYKPYTIGEVPDDHTKVTWRDRETGEVREATFLKFLEEVGPDADRIDTTKYIKIGNQFYFASEMKPSKTPGMVRARPAGTQSRKEWRLYGVDAKQSRSDWLSWKAKWEERIKYLDYMVIVAPQGLIDPDELPPRVGLIELFMRKPVIEDSWGMKPNLIMKKQPQRFRNVQPLPDADRERLIRSCYFSLQHLLMKPIRNLFWYTSGEFLEKDLREREVDVDAKDGSRAYVRGPGEPAEGQGGEVVRSVDEGSPA